MATLTSFTGPSGSVTPGATVRFDAIFSVSAGQSDQTLTGELRDAQGTVIATATIVVDRPDPEPDPTGLTFRLADASGASVGTVTGFTGTRTAPDSYTASWTVTVP